jgi:hypothetical protein
MDSMPSFLTAANPTTSSPIQVNQSIKMTFQLAVKGSGSVAANAVIEGSHDGLGWINIATLNASGTDYASDGGTLETYWPQVRARLVTVTGTATIYYGV